MFRYLVRRLPSLGVVLVVASTLIFGIIRLIPGDPASSLAGPDAPPETIAAIRHDLGLDQSILSQYWHWLGDVLRFDLGRSYMIGGDIEPLITRGLGNTAVLTVAGLVIAVGMSLVLGMLWATTRSRVVDSVLTGATTVFLALPPFVTGVLLVLFFGVTFSLLPTSGLPPNGFVSEPDIAAQYLLLPAVCLALPVAAVLTRFLAESLRTELRQPYVMTAMALGVSRRRLIARHALRNALPTSVTVLGVQIGNLLGGAVLVEAVFAWPGLGSLIQQAISRRDYPVVQILLLLSVAVFVVIQLFTDVIHALLDPRIRIGG